MPVRIGSSSSLSLNPNSLPPMTSRRHVIKTLGLSAISMHALGSVPQTNIHLLKDDPNYWKAIREQFSLSKDSVFFNPGTVGAMPKVVVQKMIDHLQYIASNVSDWAYVQANNCRTHSGRKAACDPGPRATSE